MKEELIKMKNVLVIVDMVKGFKEFGNMAITDAGHIDPEIVKLVKEFLENGDEVISIQEGHEVNSEEFKDFPSHCIIGTPEAELVFKNADCIILDSQYTVEEANRKQNWGHSAFCNAVDFAIHWGIKKLYLFHHEPTYDDKKLNSILQAARWYAQYIEHSDVQIYLAKEAQEINL